MPGTVTASFGSTIASSHLHPPSPVTKLLAQFVSIEFNKTKVDFHKKKNKMEVNFRDIDAT
jgi:hypothetical protein